LGFNKQWFAQMLYFDFNVTANRRPIGIDPEKGIGTAYEGYVKVSIIFAI